ncbi:MAG: ParA family protein [Alphaproteobacteria bacterium]
MSNEKQQKSKTIAVTNQKGGVGKTTIAFNLAKGLASRGKKILAIDNDPQGNLTSAMLEDPESLSADILKIFNENVDFKPQTIQKNLDFIGATISLEEVAEKSIDIIFLLKEYIGTIDSQYDLIIVDCLPSFGHLNLAALNAADYVLIPTKAAPFALHGLTSLIKNVTKTQARLNPNLQIAGIVLNLLENTVIHKQLEENLRTTYGNAVFNSRISKGVKFEESPFFNESIMEYGKTTKQSKQFNAFIREFLKRV